MLGLLNCFQNYNLTLKIKQIKKKNLKKGTKEIFIKNILEFFH